MYHSSILVYVKESVARNKGKTRVRNCYFTYSISDQNWRQINFKLVKQVSLVGPTNVES